MYQDSGTTNNITFGSNTDNITYSHGEQLYIGGMNDLVRAVDSQQLTIRSYDTTGSATDMIVPYSTFDPFATNSATSQNLIFTSNDNSIVWKIEPAKPRTRGRTLNRHGRGARCANFDNATQQEIVALQLLKGLVGQDDFRRYLKYGFVMVRGHSGLRYQIERGRHVVGVWNERSRIDGICVYLDGPFPPTDGVITRMLMAERDELELWRRGNSKAGRSVTTADLMRLYGVEVAA